MKQKLVRELTINSSGEYDFKTEADDLQNCCLNWSNNWYVGDELVSDFSENWLPDSYQSDEI